MTRAPFESVPAQPVTPALVDDGDTALIPDLRAIAHSVGAARSRVGASTLAGAVLLFAIAMLLPPRYVADVSVLEAPRAGGNPALEQIGLSAQMLGLNAGATANALTYPDILRSRRLLGQLLGSRFTLRTGRVVTLESHLMRGAPSPQRNERALVRLRKRFDIALDRRTNLLRVSVTDRDPVLAAGVANAAAAALQDVVMRSMMTQAGANRRFVETRLAQARLELARAEAALERFRDVNRHTDGSPRLLMEQSRLVRELRTREEVVVALTREYEMARVNENRDVPVLNVLDAARPPAFRSWPRRGLMAVSGALAGFALGAYFAWRGREGRVDPALRAEAA